MDILIETAQTRRRRLGLMPIPSTSKKMNMKELYAHIQSLTAQMDDEEKERFYDEAEKEGF